MAALPDNLPNVHSLVELTSGRCHYRVDGPESGPTLLLVHGATVPAWEFDRLVPYLTEAGWRTVRADLYGHGYSARPRVPHDHALFAEQHLELLDHLGIQAPVHVLGHSLGAAVGATIAATRPERVASLVLAAPLLDFYATNGAARLLDYPIVGEALVATVVVPGLVRRRRRRYRGIEGGRFAGLFRRQLDVPGFGRALLSMFRAGTLGDQTACYRAAKQPDRPVLVLRGTADSIIPLAHAERIAALMGAPMVQPVADAPHSLMLTHPERVAAAVLAFLAAPAARDGVSV